MTKARLAMPDVVIVVIAIWVIFMIEALLPGNLTQWGIHPRRLSGLAGIISSPFIHGSLYHIISNTLPLLVLGFFIQLKSRALFWELFIVLSLLVGLGVWIFGSAGSHIGASGVIFGMWSFILADAFYSKQPGAIAVAGLTLLFYGGLWLTLLDMRTHVSWAGHFCGLLVGVAVAWYENQPETERGNNSV